MKPIVITYGMGIGPEVTLQALTLFRPSVPVRLLGRESSLVAASEFLKINLENHGNASSELLKFLDES